MMLSSKQKKKVTLSVDASIAKNTRGLQPARLSSIVKQQISEMMDEETLDQSRLIDELASIVPDAQKKVGETHWKREIKRLRAGEG